MRLARTGLLLALASQGIYWLGVFLRGAREPLSLLGLVLAEGYGAFFLALTALGLLIAAWGLVAGLRRRGRAG